MGTVTDNSSNLIKAFREFSVTSGNFDARKATVELLDQDEEDGHI